MANIVIDPLIIIVPSENSTKAIVEKWFDNLSIWLTEALTAPFTWLHCLQASELLEAYGQFPSFSELRKLQQKYRLDINVIQLARNINEFFRDETFDLKYHLDLLVFAVEPETNSISVEPMQFMDRLPQYLHKNIYTLLTDICICKLTNKPLGKGLYIATLILSETVKNITVTFTVRDAIPDFARPSDNIIIQAFPLLITPNDLFSNTNIIELWNKGEQGIVYAIQQEHKSDRVSNSTPPFKFQLGPYFIRSINERGLNSNLIALRSIIRAAVDIISDKAQNINGYHLHPFRENDAPDSSQLIRAIDSARAWRLIIQKKGAGWRLNYWQIPTPEGIVIEFANVGKETEREIY